MNGVITQAEIEELEHLVKEQEIQNFVLNIKTTSLKYIAAMKETKTKVEILNEDFKFRYNYNPIEHIETRIKSPESILKKMNRLNIDFNINDLTNNIFDIAGVRVVCSFVSDIFKVVDMIYKNKEITILKEKDYINNPKESGYRSYHMIISVPIYLTTGIEHVPVEIQLRTMAMDFWASLEHKIKYKYDGVVPDEVKQDLLQCSQSIQDLDLKMLSLHNIVKEVNGENLHKNMFKL